MKKHITKFVLAVGLLATGAIGLSRTEDVFASEINLQVTPSRFQLKLKPGETYTGSFNVYNNGEEDISVETSTSPYTVENDNDGNQKVLFDKETEYTEILGWTTFSEKNLVIPKGDRAIVEFTIKVPADAPGGGQYEYLSIDAKGRVDGESDITIGQNASIGPIVYATIDGETRRTGKIYSNDISGFLFNPPISANTVVENLGNIHTNVKHILKVYPIFSSESIYNNEENPHEETLLPGIKRYIATNWDEAPAIGIYKVISEVEIFDETSTTERTVIICPMWVLILILVFIAAVIFWIVSRVKSRKQS